MTVFGDLGKLITDANTELGKFSTAVGELTSEDGTTLDSYIRGIVNDELSGLNLVTPVPEGTGLPLDGIPLDQSISLKFPTDNEMGIDLNPPLDQSVLPSFLNENKIRTDPNWHPLGKSLPVDGVDKTFYPQQITMDGMPVVPQDQSSELENLKSALEDAKSKASDAMNKAVLVGTDANKARLDAIQAKDIAKQALSVAKLKSSTPSIVEVSDAETPDYI